VATLEPLCVVERARAKETKRKLVEAGITPTKPTYDSASASYYPGGSTSTGGPGTSNALGNTQGSINLSDFNFSDPEMSNNPNKTNDPRMMTNDPHRPANYDHTKSNYDHTRSVTNESLRSLLTNPLKARLASGNTGSPSNNITMYAGNGTGSPSQNITRSPTSGVTLHTGVNPASPALNKGLTASTGSAGSSTPIMTRSPTGSTNTPEVERTTFAKMSTDNISQDRQTYFTDNKDHL